MSDQTPTLGEALRAWAETPSGPLATEALDALADRADALEQRARGSVAEVLRLDDVVTDLRAQVERVRALAESWRYKGEFGWGAWQEGEGPDEEGHILDNAAAELRATLAGDENELARLRGDS